MRRAAKAVLIGVAAGLSLSTMLSLMFAMGCPLTDVVLERDPMADF